MRGVVRPGSGTSRFRIQPTSPNSINFRSFQAASPSTLSSSSFQPPSPPPPHSPSDDGLMLLARFLDKVRSTQRLDLARAAGKEVSGSLRMSMLRMETKKLREQWRQTVCPAVQRTLCLTAGEIEVLRGPGYAAAVRRKEQVVSMLEEATA
eukprot:CAMPEP_0174919182 /NCGR_PEP_ID=MMETSP1355-20121228/3526_1 /TAXON_ID=464990 /ORGANISM="Hemiselmis tepida, Strain CCMP443" /LENGTH=150 /DNA_ID=CAMNT_0016164395 /DNA_START=32 /DNA_END=480 /DNA_ORIENTATION=+